MDVDSQSVNESSAVEPPPEAEQDQEHEEAGNFWADHLLQYNPSFTLGHPYLHGQWGTYQADKRQHILKSSLVAILLVGLILLSPRLGISYFWLYYLIPALCIAYGIFSMRKFKRKNAELSVKERKLKAASQAIKENCSSLVQYSVEDIGQNKMGVLKNAVPNCRVVVEGGKWVPKYCGSWPIENWRALTESDRLGLHTEYRYYVTGKTWHSVDQCFALLTDSGTVLWLV